MTTKTLAEIYAVVQQRQESNPKESYVASLFHKGLDKILKKVGEEASEVLIASKNGDKSQVVHEIADLWFHCLVLMVQQGVELKDIEEEFGRRFGTSGHAEKASRLQ